MRTQVTAILLPMIRILFHLLLIALTAPVSGCGQERSDPAEATHSEVDPAPAHLEVHAATPRQQSDQTPPPTRKTELHPRELYDWSRAPYAMGFGPNGAPFLRDPPCPRGQKSYPGCRRRLTQFVQERTKAVHLHVTRALGLDEEEPRLWQFLVTRSATETTHNGSQRPLDGGGSVHRLDVGAAWRAGVRRRSVYLEAGNPLATKEHSRIWLSYGPQGQNSWLFLDKWDPLGDPRMLADTVISDLTRVRVAREQLAKLTTGSIRCYEYDDEGRVLKTPWNGRSYRVASVAVDEDSFAACMAEGPSKNETDGAMESRCSSASRVTYSWRPGRRQPENTVAVPYLDWWNLKRAMGGAPCPPWKGDEYEAHKRENWARVAKRNGFSDWEKPVRKIDLGYEPEGDQYDLWRSIWSAVVFDLDGEVLDWEELEGVHVDTVEVVGPTPEKLAEQRLLARDPEALQKRFHDRATAE